ncbi:zinc finger BED domain-containing protein 5 [Trichonephila clavipes]|nr:zinc finger BED domain-containing protein 5 [Trichonephila clavipes]
MWKSPQFSRKQILLRSLKKKGIARVYLQVDDHVHPGKCPAAVSSEKKQDLLHMEFYHHLPSWAMNEQMSYFSSFSDEWSRDLKSVQVQKQRSCREGLSITEEESFIDFTSSGEIKGKFCNKTLFQFWAEIDDEFSELKTKAFRILLPFSTSYLCETEFSAVAALKTKYRSQLNIEKNSACQFLILSLHLKPFALQDKPMEVTNNN